MSGRERHSGPLVRAELRPLGQDASQVLRCHYNPGTMTLAKSARWTFSTTASSGKAPPPTFVGVDPQTLSTDLLFDAFEGEAGGVVTAVHRLVSWTCATKESIQRKTPQPPMLVLQWGLQSYGPGYLKSVSVKYTLFDTNGEPLRATASVVLAEVPVVPPGTNPTSGGVPGRRSVVLRAGDCLPTVAHREYGDPNLWRAIAVANDVDDPSRLPAGTVLLLPPRAQAAVLSGTGDGGAGHD